MQTLTVVIASVAGLGLGYAVAAHFASRAKALLLERYQEEKAVAVEKADLTIRELRDELSDERGKPDDGVAGGEASKSRGKSKKKNKHKGKAKGGNTESNEVVLLKSAQADIEKRHTEELSKLRGTHDAALAEIKKSGEAQKADFSKALVSLQSELDEALEAGSAAPAGNAEFVKALDSAGSDLNPVLESIISVEGQTAAVLADASGIIVASAGDVDTKDNISASAGILMGIPKQLQGMLPLDANYGFRFSDQNNTIMGRTFDVSGDLLALVTVGPTAPADDSIDLAVNSLHKALE